MVQPPRPRHKTPSSTFSNHLNEQEADRRFFADLERRIRTMDFEPTERELRIAWDCVELMRRDREDRDTNVFDILREHIDDFDRHIKLTRVILTLLYAEGIDLGRKK